MSKIKLCQFKVVISPKSSVYNGPIVPDFAEKPEGVDLDYR